MQILTVSGIEIDGSPYYREYKCPNLSLQKTGLTSRTITPASPIKCSEQPSWKSFALFRRDTFSADAFNPSPTLPPNPLSPTTSQNPAGFTTPKGPDNLPETLRLCRLERIVCFMSRPPLAPPLPSSYFWCQGVPEFFLRAVGILVDFFGETIRLISPAFHMEAVGI
ncbi:hypothetical protein AVEN_82638-1 [Araneus ventricosus]|uniref:Uncharacterized protein n=1 Tax=Araneus ventricosus TaxID=182803 RepID=A0A4Y2SN24_ARAVE|nr:hypothetical protein AVEN_273622-1 [Araneus ventricosus]GBN89705.1 hypothetical protein AVEN_82638-1 [Araneus ventricosus]